MELLRHCFPHAICGIRVLVYMATNAGVADTTAVGSAGISGRYGMAYRSESVDGRIRKTRPIGTQAGPTCTDRALSLYRPGPTLVF